MKNKVEEIVKHENPTLKINPSKFLACSLWRFPNSLINVKFIRRENDVIEIYRNKRKPIKRVKEMFKNEDGCIACCLFDVCLDWTGRRSSTCEVMEDAGVVGVDEKRDRFFVDV